MARAAIRARPAAATPDRSDHGEPPVLKEDHGQVVYRALPGELFVRRAGEPWDQRRFGASARDMEQGWANDCHFIAAAAVVAELRPNLLHHAIRDNEDGTYTVRFLRAREVIEVRVTNLVPIRLSTGLPAYARSPRPAEGDPWELWPMILEKAYAKLHGGYEGINAGGEMRDVLALTGMTVREELLEGSDPARVFEMIQEVTAAGGLMLANTPRTPEIDLHGIGLSRWHVYAVLDWRTRADGVPVVVLRNPWGRHEPGQTQGNGIFEYPIADFVRHFEFLAMAVRERPYTRERPHRRRSTGTSLPAN